MANNPLDYLIKDQDAMRYALLNDSSYRVGGQVQHFGGGGKAEEDIFALKPQSKPAVPTVRELVAEIGKNPARYEAKYPPKDATPIEMQAYQLMQAAKKTPDAGRYLESLNPYFDSQLRFDIGAGSDAGYVKFKEPNIAVMQKLQDVKNTIPHELTHTLQLGKGKDANPNIEGNLQTFLRQNDLSQEMRDKVFPSSNVTNMKEVWANVAARAHEVNAAGGDFINSPEGKALFPTNTEKRDYYTNAMPGVNSLTPDTGTFVPNRRYAEGGGVFNPQGADYDYQTARAYGMGQDGGNWGSVAPASEGERKLHGLPEDSYLMLKGAEHPTWGKAVEAETARGSKIVKHGDRYYSVPSKAEGGEVSQDQMRYELDRANSPVMQATPRSAMQDAIGTAGGYMDKAGKFVSEAIAPTAEKHPVKHFLANMILADSLKSAGTALQDYTGTVRETDEDNPVRGVISKNFRNLTNSTEPLLDPRALDLAGFATPVVKGVTKLAGAGAKALTPFAKNTAEMAAELYGRGQMPGMVAPNAYMAEPSAPKPAKALAPANEQGFYSPTEAAALNLQRKTGNGQAFLNDLMKGENVKPDEISAMGLDTFLKDKKNVTAAEVQDYIAQNKLGLGEARYGALTKDISESRDAFKAYSQELASKYELNPNENISMYARLKNIPAEEIAKYERLQNEWLDQQPKSPKFEGWQLPGGENYREVVITTPLENSAALEAAKIKAGDLRRQTGDLMQKYKDISVMSNPGDPDLIAAYQKVAESRKLMNEAEAEADALRRVASEKTYRSSHFDEPNILAHLRMSDRVTDGKKTLLVDEVQSDWHQAGREQGYKGGDVELAKGYKWDQSAQSTLGIAEKDPAWTATDRNGNLLGHYTSENAAKEALSERTSGVPNAPYKEDWYQLALRRAVKEAIDGGYDRVALPTGARVNERFSLTKHVDAIRANLNPDGTYQLGVQPIGKSMQKFDESVPADKLASILGKDLANKITSDVKEVGVESGKIFSGLDLKVGGEGNKKYYDEIYPNYLKKFGKKYGSTVGKTTVDADGVAEPLHYMDITPAMRKEFSTGIHMKKGGKVSFAPNVDAMRHELTKAK